MTNPPNPPLYKAKFPFAHAKLAVQLQDVEQVLEKCKSSSALPAGDTFVAALQQSTQDLAQTEGSTADLKKKVAEMLSVRKGKELAFRKACLGFLGHINTLAQGDPAIIRGVGLQTQALTRRAATPLAMTVPIALAATAGTKPGEVHLKWQRVKGAKSYTIEVSRLATEGFTHLAVCITRRIVLPGQPSVTPMYYRVSAVGPLGPGPFCDAVVVVAR